ncbi:hypothetical protein AVEN_6049-1 [Araneus ventricosus]|uniref:Tc1-like transposase DDE domain-containing protein n=1 Tax=Araneus ventricosus TaxID=182803 RepID=A0A4Y2G1V4_ARAVE|nr:hypothetical protein AVEN_6049-1 [Araneus ventricosus]
MGKCKDVTEWQKGAIVFGRAHGHTVCGVSGFVGVSQWTVQRVYKQWCNTRDHKTRRQNCDRKKILAQKDRRRVSRLVLPISPHLHDEYVLVTTIFQDDNSTVHWAGRICDWFDEHSHTLLHLDWPAKSPVQNPIENLRDMLEQRVKRRNRHPRN